MALTNEIAFCLLADLKADLGITGSADDSTLERRIRAASALIEAHCGRAFRRNAAFVERLPGRGWQTLFLSLTPVQSIASISLDGVTLDSLAYTLDDAERGVVFRRDGWGSTAAVLKAAGPELVPGTEERAFVATYSGGYVLPNDTPQGPAPFLPAPIVEACLLLAAQLHQNRGRDGQIVQEQVGDASVAYAVDSIEERRAGVLPRNVVTLLKPYRRVL